MMYQGLKLEDYLKYTKQTMDDYRKGFRKQAEEQVKIQLVIDKILNVENIKAEQDEIDKKIRKTIELLCKKIYNTVTKTIKGFEFD